jgi:hypothetical protein
MGLNKHIPHMCLEQLQLHKFHLLRTGNGYSEQKQSREASIAGSHSTEITSVSAAN